MKRESEMRANVKYMRSMDSITIRPDKATGAKIRKAAADAGQSLREWIVDSCLQRINNDK